MSLPGNIDGTHSLSTPLTAIRGVGPSLYSKLSRLKLHTVEDLLFYLPYRYEDRRQVVTIPQLQADANAQFIATILSLGEIQRGRGKQRSFEMIVADNGGQIRLKWFHYRLDWLKRRYQVGQQVLVVGQVRHFNGHYEILHPDLELCRDGEVAAEYKRILPVYSLTEGVSQKRMRALCQAVATNYAQYVATAIPDAIMHRHHFLPLGEALLRVHCPTQDSDIQQLQDGRDLARTSIVFDEFFYLQLGLALRRNGIQLHQGIAFHVTHRYTKPLVAQLPFQLTAAQKKVLGEIKRDMMAPYPMNRLLQGDVGSGKTIVALLACLIAVENDTQAAVVAPTAILAEQHYQQFKHWLNMLNLEVDILTGATSRAQRQQIINRLADGTLQVIVGTHALLQPDVKFNRLGLGIIDEQHRFGVQQRNDLRKKGDNADILVMTATPIPRTLSMTIYGDLSVSVIDQLPPGRTPIKTKIVGSAQHHALLEFVKREIDKGQQGYFVYPLVEESEKSDLQAATEALSSLSQELGQKYRLELLHGRLRPQEKEAVMARFSRHEIDLLVATTVIEVGIDITNATIMVIEHAERFGLAQLHQLRGRVGRGSAPSYCILVRSEKCSAEGFQRLQVMEKNSDGFTIAEADLAQRGPGEFLGTQQAGITDFRVANLVQDGAVLELARQEAFALVNNTDFLANNSYKQLRQIMLQRWGSRLELARVG
jgi:ATP-dependent DNA helicase RecG